MAELRIENQAMMFAFLSRAAIEAKGEEGRAAIQDGMIRYGKERGARMAERARKAGDPVDLWTNQAYGEWKPDYAGQMEFGMLRSEPTYQTYIAKCAWCEAWKKNDILEYGREYCVNVDAAVYEGFGCGAVCTLVYAVDVIGPHFIICLPIATGGLLVIDGAAAAYEQHGAAGDGVVRLPVRALAGVCVRATLFDGLSGD